MGRFAVRLIFVMLCLIALCTTIVYAGGVWSSCTRITSAGGWLTYSGGAECGNVFVGWGSNGADRCRITTTSANVGRDMYFTYRHLFQKRAAGDTNARHYAYAEGVYSANVACNQQGSGNFEHTIGAKASYNWDDWLEVGSDDGGTADTVVEKAKFYPELDAVYESRSVVTSMYLGNVYQWMYKMSNPSSAWWTWNDPKDIFYHSGGVVEGPGWYGTKSVVSAPGTAPGASMTTYFNMRPTQVGTSNEDFQMIRNGVSWFGDKYASNTAMRTAVTVTRKAPACLPGEDDGARKKGETVRFSIAGADSWGAGNNYGWDFDGSTTQGWTAANNCTLTPESGNGRLKIAITGSDPHLVSSAGLAINTTNCKYMSVRMMASGGTSAQFFWQGSAGGWAENRHVDFNIYPDNKWHVYRIALPASWNGTVTQIRFDPVQNGVASGQTVYVDWLRIHSGNEGMSANLWMGVENEEWNIFESSPMTWDADSGRWYKDYAITGNYPQTYYNMMHVVNSANQQCDNDDDRRYGRYERAYKMLNTAPTAINNSFDSNSWSVTKTPELGWDYADADINPQSRYQVQIADDSEFANVIADTDLVASDASSFETPSLPEGQLYYRTRVMDGAYSNLDAVCEDGCATGAIGVFAADGGKSVEFDGATGYVSLPAGFDSFGGGFSCELWAYPTAANSWARFFDIGNGPSMDNIVLTREGLTDNVRFDVYRGATLTGRLLASNAITQDTWQHFVATIDTTGYGRIYKNGALIAHGPMAIPIVSSRSNCYIGRSNWEADSYYQGRIDEFAIYDKCLSAAEVSDHYSKAAQDAAAYRDAVCASGPWAYYQFNEETGTTAAAITGLISDWSDATGFRVDSIAPTVPSITNVAIDGSIATVTFGGSTDANDFSYEIKLDDGDFEAAVSPFDFTSLTGVHTVYVRAIDEAGNVSDAAGQEFDMTTDITAPSIDDVSSAAAVNTSPIEVSYSVSDSESGVKQVTLWVKIGSEGAWAATDQTSEDNSGTFNYAVSEEDVYFFAVVAEDNAGNLTDKPVDDGSTSTEYDITPPSVTIGSYSSGTASTGPVTFEVLIDGASDVTLADEDVTLNKTRSADAGSVSVSGTGLTTRTVTISDITGNGTLGIAIAAGVAKDAAGNLSLATDPSEMFMVVNHIASYGLSNKAAWDPIIGMVAGNTMFTVWGKVTVVDTDSFLVDDGSGMPVKVLYADHGFGNSDYVSATGTLDVSGAAPILDALVTKNQNPV